MNSSSVALSASRVHRSFDRPANLCRIRSSALSASISCWTASSSFQRSSSSRAAAPGFRSPNCAAIRSSRSIAGRKSVVLARNLSTAALPKWLVIDSEDRRTQVGHGQELAVDGAGDVCVAQEYGIQRLGIGLFSAPCEPTRIAQRNGSSGNRVGEAAFPLFLGLGSRAHWGLPFRFGAGPRQGTRCDRRRR